MVEDLEASFNEEIKVEKNLSNNLDHFGSFGNFKYGYFFVNSSILNLIFFQ